MQFNPFFFQCKIQNNGIKTIISRMHISNAIQSGGIIGNRTVRALLRSMIIFSTLFFVSSIFPLLSIIISASFFFFSIGIYAFLIKLSVFSRIKFKIIIIHSTTSIIFIEVIAFHKSFFLNIFIHINTNCLTYDIS